MDGVIQKCARCGGLAGACGRSAGFLPEKKVEPVRPWRGGPIVEAVVAAKTRQRVQEMSGAAVADRPLAEFRERLVQSMGHEAWSALQAGEAAACRFFVKFYMLGCTPCMDVEIRAIGSFGTNGAVRVKAKKEAGWIVDAHGARTVVRFKDDVISVGDRVLLAVAEVLEQGGVVYEVVERGDKG